MAKTCRTCRQAAAKLYCTVHHRNVHPTEIYDCYKPRETPLLEDALVEALKEVWDGRFTDGDTSGQYPSGGVRPGYTVWLTPKQCEMVETALARYQEEVGDA